ncbi:uncharacterized protein LOC144599921 isoform X3 [Rhinoraja longicauda]
MPLGLVFGVLVALLQSVSTQNNSNDFYIFNTRVTILFPGPINPGNGPVTWSWTSHSGQRLQRLIDLRRDNYGQWTQHLNPNFRHSDLFHDMNCDHDTVHLRISNPTFKFSGSFTLAQTLPSYKILKQYEIFGIKIEASPQQPVVGSDVTLSCTISRLSDTVSLHWRSMDSSQQNRSNTEQIRLNNTVYLIVRHVTVEDAEMYECEVQKNAKVVRKRKAQFSVDKLTAEPSDAVTEGGDVTLTCSVSYVNERLRLVWMNGDGKTVEEKTLIGEDKSLSLVIQKAERGSGNWRCGLFQQERLQLLIPYNLEFSHNYTYIIIIGSLGLLLVIILGVVLCLKKCKNKGLGNQRQKPQQTEENTEKALHLYSNAMEIQKMQGNEAPVPETSNTAEYMSVDRKAKQEGNKENIHYESISFENNESGTTHDMRCSGNSSGNKAASNEDNLVIYAQIAQTTHE